MFTMITMSLPDKRGRIDHRAPRLLWQQVADDLRAEMDSGELAIDTRLPSEFELADQYGVSRDTIRRAIQELVSENRLVVLHGRGTFVTPKPAQ
jgi:DNA-binding GntR family transcriptional regulator